MTKNGFLGQCGLFFKFRWILKQICFVPLPWCYYWPMKKVLEQLTDKLTIQIVSLPTRPHNLTFYFSCLPNLMVLLLLTNIIIRSNRLKCRICHQKIFPAHRKQWEWACLALHFFRYVTIIIILRLVQPLIFKSLPFTFIHISGVLKLLPFFFPKTLVLLISVITQLTTHSTYSFLCPEKKTWKIPHSAQLFECSLFLSIFCSLGILLIFPLCDVLEY